MREPIGCSRKARGKAWRRLSLRNLTLAALFRRTADLMEIAGENPFKIRAYRRAADAVELLPEEIGQVAEAGRLTQVPGIGAGLREKIEGWLATGRLDPLDEIERRAPAGLLEIVRLPGVGPALARRMHEEAGVEDLASLKRALEDGSLKAVKGFGPRVEALLRRGMRALRAQEGTIPYGEAADLWNRLSADLTALDGVERAEPAGAFRRREELLARVEGVVAARRPKRVVDRLLKWGGKAHPAPGAEEAAWVVVEFTESFPLHLFVTTPEAFAAAWVCATGSRRHVRGLQLLARMAGRRLDALGLWRGASRLDLASEDDIYDRLGLRFVPPELRQGDGELRLAKLGRLPDLIELKHIRGDLHVHSAASDGEASLDEIVQHGSRLGYAYVAICDHSPSLRIGNGLSARRLKEQARAIEAVNRKEYGCTLLAGSEVDILADGRLDYDDETLAELDVVVASAHSGLSDGERLTERLIEAARHPLVDIIAHPTGRLLGRRAAAEIDLDALYDAAAESGTALEINASAGRLDLGREQARRAAGKGCWLVINTDAHRLDEMEAMELGVGIARGAWLEPGRVLNAMPLDSLMAFLKTPKAERPAPPSTA